MSPPNTGQPERPWDRQGIGRGQVIIAGERDQVGLVLHGPTSPPGNLPLELTSFVGREGEIAEARRRLGGTRLLTLTGPGGSGKTRLALELAAGVGARFEEGVW